MPLVLIYVNGTISLYGIVWQEGNPWKKMCFSPF
jgi:hypothetical protein